MLSKVDDSIPQPQCFLCGEQNSEYYGLFVQRVFYIGDTCTCLKCLIDTLSEQLYSYTLQGIALDIQQRTYTPPVLTELQRKRRAFDKMNKKKILERDEYRCKQCGSWENLHVDHIKPLSKGGTNDEKNLQALCAKCNLSKGNRPAKGNISVG